MRAWLNNTIKLRASVLYGMKVSDEDAEMAAKSAFCKESFFDESVSDEELADEAVEELKRFLEKERAAKPHP